MRRKLLLADDSVTIQRVVELTFSGEDIDVVTVSDGEQAIARISATPFDIVLADIAMPKKSGYEVAAFVKEHPTMSNVPVLLLAGAFEPVDEERAKRVKCDGVLVKPFETHEVITRVRELLEGKREALEQTVAADAAPETAAPQAAAPPATAPQVATPQAVTPQAGASQPAPPPSPKVVEAPPAAPPDESLDDYFDRLDVAFATRAQTPPRPFPHLTPPTLPPDPPPAFIVPEAARETGGAIESGERNVIAELFRVFLEVEQGERDAASIQIPEEFDRIRRGNRIE